ncbi:unnamed protein product [Rhizoctonia solani]|uniref:Zn(2)-C6 fungal-type domain-containing protein n=1 Tax=Rhizoctonia solani TaxID=456999 RepID=A0A8H3H6W1_9AGAM|nr:unnamed protein product [Rhizoctonia solani]
MDTRSTTGCGTCKSRRKKCDETHPKCQRCTKLGLVCSGYQYTENVPGQHKKPRTKPEIPPMLSVGSILPESSRRKPTAGNSHELGSLMDTSSSLVSPEMKPSGSSLDCGPSPANSLQSASGSLSALSLDIWQYSNNNWDSSPQPFPMAVMPRPGSISGTHATGAPQLYFGQNSLNPLGNPISMVHRDTTAGSFKNFGGIADIQNSSEVLRNSAHISSEYTAPYSKLYMSSSCSLERPFCVGWEEQETDDDDPEGLKETLYISPVMDSSVKDNTIPVALQTCAQWCLLVMFEPLKISQSMKQHVTDQIISSDSSRAWMIFAVSILRAGVNQKSACYTSKRVSLEPNIDRQLATNLLNDYLDIISIQAPTHPLRSSYRLLQDAAPIFRFACPDPLGLPVYLPRIMMNPPFSLLYFVALDVTMSVASGRPMLCNYDPGSSLELCDQLLQSDNNYGFQWLFGAPDQYILLLARINTLYERQGANLEPYVLDEIAEDLSKLRFSLAKSSDPALMVTRTAVQEGWRQAMYVYLYMTLYKANSEDQRVEQARKTFMRLVNVITPGHGSDGFLVIPMMIVGVVLLKRRDRDSIRKRILGLRECRNPESAWNDNVRMLEDIWGRTAAENRPATWIDLRIAWHKVTQM